jgi:nicotinate dehydrogenase subunit A
MPTYRLDVNGDSHRVEARDPGEPLLYVLRNALGLTGAKFGCGLGQCGACTVLVDGAAMRACMLPVGEVGARKVTTLEGLGTPEKPHPLQAAFIAEQAAQCGYCTSGMVMAAAALLATRPHPSEDDVRRALQGNLCRCGSHVRVLRAVLRAAEAKA